MEAPDKLGQQVFAYRAFDLRDRFPQPLETFRDALELLQSDDAYMAAMSGEIMAYLRGGAHSIYRMTFSYTVLAIVSPSWAQKKMIPFVTQSTLGLKKH